MSDNFQEVQRKEFALRFRSELRRLGLTQVAAAKSSGVSRNAMVSWARGYRTPRQEQFRKLAAIGFDVAYLASGGRKEEKVRRELALDALRAARNAIDLAIAELGGDDA